MVPNMQRDIFTHQFAVCKLVKKRTFHGVFDYAHRDCLDFQKFFRRLYTCTFLIFHAHFPYGFSMKLVYQILCHMKGTNEVFLSYEQIEHEFSQTWGVCSY